MNITLKMLTLALALCLAAPSFGQEIPAATTAATTIGEPASPTAPGFYG